MEAALNTEDNGMFDIINYYKDKYPKVKKKKFFLFFYTKIYNLIFYY